jgi:hypothetical protein
MDEILLKTRLYRDEYMSLLTLVEKLSAALAPYGLKIETDEQEHDGYEVVILTKLAEKTLTPTVKLGQPFECEGQLYLIAENANATHMAELYGNRNLFQLKLIE